MSIFKVYSFAGLCLLALLFGCMAGEEHAKDNGDIYVIDEEHFDKSKDATKDTAVIDTEEIMKLCNTSFSIPLSYLEKFNATGELPDIVDKTGMCYIRCFYEMAGIIDNWKLNVDKVRAIMWPATGDSIEYCEKQQQNESNACVRTYAIAKCLMIRAIVDARNKPVV